jgi:hypothetical protein
MKWIALVVVVLVVPVVIAAPVALVGKQVAARLHEQPVLTGE